jgi:hypothetical protein
MNTKPMDEFLGADQEGQLSKVEPDPQDGVYKKDDELPRLQSPAKATAPPPMNNKIEELSDEGDMLAEASERATESHK